MAVRFFLVSAPGVVAESENDQDNLSIAVQDAIDAAAEANEEEGSNADVATELAAVTAALEALTGGLPGGPLLVSVDAATITDRNKLRRYLDAVYDHITSTDLIS